MFDRKSFVEKLMFQAAQESGCRIDPDTIEEERDPFDKRHYKVQCKYCHRLITGFTYPNITEKEGVSARFIKRNGNDDNLTMCTRVVVLHQ